MALALAEPAVEVGGFVEAYGSLNSNGSTDRINALRGFDARHGGFALSLAAVEVGIVDERARGRVALQVGPTALATFAAEPTTPAATGVPSTSAADLHHVREAWAGFTLAEGLTVDGGVFLSPVGYDAIAAKDNRFWSLSNLGVGLPFYFTGARSAFTRGGTTVTAGVFDGWNKVVDVDARPAWMASVGHTNDAGLEAQVLWLGGDEGTGGFRQLLDAWVDVPVGPTAIVVAGDVGAEPREGGWRTWQAAQIGVEAFVDEAWSVGARGDVFFEQGPDDAPIFWPTEQLGEVTASVGWRPADGLLVRLEGRHDRAADPVFSRGTQPASATSQSTLTLGLSGGASAVVGGPR